MLSSSAGLLALLVFAAAAFLTSGQSTPSDVDEDFGRSRRGTQFCMNITVYGSPIWDACRRLKSVFAASNVMEVRELTAGVQAAVSAVLMTPVRVNNFEKSQVLFCAQTYVGSIMAWDDCWDETTGKEVNGKDPDRVVVNSLRINNLPSVNNAIMLLYQQGRFPVKGLTPEGILDKAFGGGSFRRHRKEKKGAEPTEAPDAADDDSQSFRRHRKNKKNAEPTEAPDAVDDDSQSFRRHRKAKKGAEPTEAPDAADDDSQSFRRHRKSKKTTDAPDDVDDDSLSFRRHRKDKKTTDAPDDVDDDSLSFRRHRKNKKTTDAPDAVDDDSLSFRRHRKDKKTTDAPDVADDDSQSFRRHRKNKKTTDAPDDVDDDSQSFRRRKNKKTTDAPDVADEDSLSFRRHRKNKKTTDAPDVADDDSQSFRRHRKNKDAQPTDSSNAINFKLRPPQFMAQSASAGNGRSSLAAGVIVGVAGVALCVFLLVGIVAVRVRQRRSGVTSLDIDPLTSLTSDAKVQDVKKEEKTSLMEDARSTKNYHTDDYQIF